MAPALPSTRLLSISCRLLHRFNAYELASSIRNISSPHYYSNQTFTKNGIEIGHESEPAVCEWIDWKTKIHCFRLSESNKRALLQKAASAAEKRLSGSKAYLERLHKVSPELASQFSLRETGISKAPLRLLVKEDSKLVADPFYQIESYIALSYCWHNEEWTPAPNYHKDWWPISDRMMSLLQHNCKPNEGIWIDQLCIHQNNADEKRLAISTMGQIYQSSRELFVAIEDITLSKKDQDSAIAYAYKEQMEPRAAAEIVLKLASSRWFSRAWCSHELKMVMSSGKNAFLLIGLQDPDSGIWKAPVMGFYPNFAAQKYILQPTEAENRCDTALYLQYLGFLNGESSILENPTTENMQLVPSLSVQQLHSTEGLSCSIITDKLSIMLNTSGLELVFNQTISDTDELNWIISTLALALGDPGVLSATGPRLWLSTKDKDEKIQSWVQRFTAKDWTIQARLQEPLGIKSVSKDMIELDLLVIHNDPILPSDEAIKCGIDFVKACYAASCPTLSPYYSASQLSIPNTINRLGHNVATIIDLGLGWIQSAWPMFEENILNADKRWKSVATPDHTLWAPTKTHLLPYLLAGQSSIETDNESDVEKYRDILEPFLSFFLSPDIRGNILAPSILRTGPNLTDFALFDPNSDFHDNRPQIFKYAIPTCMATSPFQRSTRVWVLEELADEGSVPTTGRPGMSFLINQAVRHGGDVIKEPLEDGVTKVVIKPGEITDDYWDTLQAGMTRNNLHEWIVGQGNDSDAINKLNCESGCWRLVEKGVLWGCPDLKVDEKFVTLKTRQKVYGFPKAPADLVEQKVDEIIQTGLESFIKENIAGTMAENGDAAEQISLSSKEVFEKLDKVDRDYPEELELVKEDIKEKQESNDGTERCITVILGE